MINNDDEDESEVLDEGKFIPEEDKPEDSFPWEILDPNGRRRLKRRLQDGETIPTDELEGLAGLSGNSEETVEELLANLEAAAAAAAALEGDNNSGSTA